MSSDVLKNQAAHGGHDDHAHHDSGENTVLGFWIYLMTDLILFGCLFAAYAVLSYGYADGPTSKEVFGNNLHLILLNTALLLVSSLTSGLAMLARHKGGQKAANAVVFWLFITFLLGAGFVGIELYEFKHLIAEGAGPDRSAFLSAFFTLVGTHGLHVTIGLIWILVLMHQVKTKGVTAANYTRLSCFSLFWHFLDIVWICVFTFVYLFGVL